jgi:hypothetical protein
MKYITLKPQWLQDVYNIVMFGELFNITALLDVQLRLQQP